MHLQCKNCGFSKNLNMYRACKKCLHPFDCRPEVVKDRHTRAVSPKTMAVPTLFKPDDLPLWSKFNVNSDGKFRRKDQVSGLKPEKINAP